MPEYLSKYDDTERIELDDGFWVDVKKCLTGSQMRAIRAKQITRGVESFTDPQTGADRIRSVIVNIDADLYAYELAVGSIVDWNFESKGKKWPLQPDAAKRAHYDNLTEQDQDTIEDVVVGFNAEPTKNEAAQFSDDGEGSVPAGQDDDPDDGEVHRGAELVETVGAPAGPASS
jgi:hypothetical protein